MIIKLAILDSDKEYLKKLVEKLSMDYADGLEVRSFSEQEDAYRMMESWNASVLLAAEQFEVDADRLPAKCTLVYLTADINREPQHNHPTIAKYQKPELIYKQVLALYAENAGKGGSLRKKQPGSAYIISFQPVSGGAGASTAAAACALHFANLGKKVLYLNLERCGTADTYFSAPGNLTLSDIIYTLKSSKGNLPMKMESCVRTDLNGVRFFAGTQSTLHMLELTIQEKIRLVETAEMHGGYDYIVLDLDFSLNKEDLSLVRLSDAVVWVGCGDEVSNNKLLRSWQALRQMEEQENSSITDRVCLVYNRWSSTGSQMPGIDMRQVGGIQRVVSHSASKGQMLEHIAGMSLFDDLVH
ncbi:MAG: AAA family ATPase [Lachnospiraceae bacterium]|nr:AAA family ATPase [Lachnospiraceae bacterium]